MEGPRILTQETAKSRRRLVTRVCPLLLHWIEILGNLAAHNSCHDIKKVCTDRKDSILDGICANKEVHNITDCGLTANRCVPNTVVCGGKTYNARNYTGVLGLCERTVDVKCGATVITLENLCRISEVCLWAISPPISSPPRFILLLYSRKLTPSDNM